MSDVAPEIRRQIEPYHVLSAQDDTGIFGALFLPTDPCLNFVGKLECFLACIFNLVYKDDVMKNLSAFMTEQSETFSVQQSARSSSRCSAINPGEFTPFKRRDLQKPHLKRSAADRKAQNP